MAILPASSVTLTDPFRTMSIIVEKAFGLSRSVGEIKLPAALLITISGTFEFSVTF